MKKKIKQAELDGGFQPMTLRVPKRIHKILATKRKETGKSFNKMTIEALSEYLKK